MPDPLSPLIISVRLGASVVAAGLLGWEREVNEKSAGLRTHMMVSLGAATILVVGQQMLVEFQAGGDSVRIDPSRLVQAVMGGIGFLCAGAIIQSGRSVRGLTTAASVWLSAAVGTACGLGYFTISLVATLAGLIVLVLVKTIERNPRRTGDDERSATDHS